MERVEIIKDKLSNGLKFGLFEKGSKCYFQDGTHVSYSDLWKAVKAYHNIDTSTTKTLSQLCPESYVGTHDYSYKKHNWRG